MQYSLRTLLVLVTGIAIVLAMLNAPLARIDAETAALIRPGMTIQEATAIIGGPEGKYDGVQGMYTDQPATKGYYPEWMGAKGVIMLSLNAQEDRVAISEFYPGRDVTHSWLELAVERLTRQQGGNLSARWRLVACPILLLLGLWIVGRPIARWVRGDTRVAHAIVGLIIGAVAGMLLSWSVVSFTLEVALCTLVAAGIGAIMGLFIGYIRTLPSLRRGA